ncbi:Lipase [Quillaja saponaria]|uniref:Lipase n=1 Tax=Quillaja saponaria TaxID=32244 RepID=A0AAD7P6V3_QUISA|nr:Lipase [Quillaja saponaria]
MASHDFSGNYMVLRPEEVGLVDLFLTLWCCDIEKRAFVECSEGKKKIHFRYRWFIFLSVLGQKILLSLAKPMSNFGSWFEQWLNLPSYNSKSWVLLLCDLLRGKLLMTDKTSETFVSIFGHLDKRVELDRDIKPGDTRYHAALSAMASKIAYENKAFIETTVRDHWKMEVLGSYDFWNDFQEKETTQAFFFHDKNDDSDVIVVAFRGTEPYDADAWCTDLDLSWYEIPGMGKIHGGFMKALGLLRYRGWPMEIEKDAKHQLAYYSIREKLKEQLQLQGNCRTRFIVTGHSLGGALAILFPAILAFHEETWLLNRLEGVYTFGQPRVGDKEFKDFMEEQLQNYGFKYLRFVYCNDIIPRLPMDDSTFLFKHFGTCLYYNSCYGGKILEEEPNKNYFKLLDWIPILLNAIWELVRSFIIPYTKGPDYAEGWLLKSARVFGLVFPGLAAHNPQDYVNSTRLGAAAIYLQLQ